MVRNAFRYAAVLLALAALLTSCGLKRHKYDNPITKDTQQPDKVLFDAAVGDIEHSRFERARLTLQTLMNTYDTSEYLAKAKLAIADSWFREGGAHGFAQAEAEYKDFILFYPTMEEAAEAQEKICKMQYQQMEKSDRDPCTPCAPKTNAASSCAVPQQQVRARSAADAAQHPGSAGRQGIQGRGTSITRRAAWPPRPTACRASADQFPLYSGADEALWELADSYHRMGDKFENQQAQPIHQDREGLSAERARGRGQGQAGGHEAAVPEADPVALTPHEVRAGEPHQARYAQPRCGAPFAAQPDMTLAAKSGSPQMTGFRPPSRTACRASRLAGDRALTDVTATGTVTRSQRASITMPDAPRRCRRPAAWPPAPAALPQQPPAGAPPRRRRRRSAITARRHRSQHRTTKSELSQAGKERSTGETSRWPSGRTLSRCRT